MKNAMRRKLRTPRSRRVGDRTVKGIVLGAGFTVVMAVGSAFWSPGRDLVTLSLRSMAMYGEQFAGIRQILAHLECKRIASEHEWLLTRSAREILGEQDIQEMRTAKNPFQTPYSGLPERHRLQSRLRALEARLDTLDLATMERRRFLAGRIEFLTRLLNKKRSLSAATSPIVERTVEDFPHRRIPFSDPLVMGLALPKGDRGVIAATAQIGGNWQLKFSDSAGVEERRIAQPYRHGRRNMEFLTRSGFLFFADGKRVFRIRVSPKTHEVPLTITPEISGLAAFSVSSDGRKLVVGTSQEISIWDVPNRKLIRKVQLMTGEKAPPWLRERVSEKAVVFSPDARWIFTSLSPDGTYRFIEVSSGITRVLHADAWFSLKSAVFAKDSHTLYTLHSRPGWTLDLDIVRWEAGNPNSIGSVSVKVGQKRIISDESGGKFSPDGRYLFVWDSWEGRSVWDVEGKRSLYHLPASGSREAYFSEDAKRLMTREGGWLHVWDFGEVITAR